MSKPVTLEEAQAQIDNLQRELVEAKQDAEQARRKALRLAIDIAARWGRKADIIAGLEKALNTQEVR